MGRMETPKFPCTYNRHDFFFLLVTLLLLSAREDRLVAVVSTSFAWNSNKGT